jgi:hypothetical protein
LNGDDVDDDADLQDALSWRLVHCNGGASSTMARWFSEVLRELFVKNKRKRRRGWWRREDGRKGGS